MNKDYFGIVDCETCTIPELKKHSDNAGLNFPLIYDVAIQIQDKEGKIFHRQQWIISETFSREYFNTAYYVEKRPFYVKLVKENPEILVTWEQAKIKMLEIMEKYNIIACAYNAFFDFKKAFHSTNRFVNALYGLNNSETLNKLIKNVLYYQKNQKKLAKKYKNPNSQRFWLIDRYFPIIDIWNFACQTVFQTVEYKEMAVKNGWYSPAGNYTTNAEVAYRFITNNVNFIEKHTALEDVIIEGEILKYIFDNYKVKTPYGIEGFPWRKVGKVPKK